MEIEKLYKKLKIGEKANLLKLLNAEFSKLVHYDYEKISYVKSGLSGQKWIQKNRKEKDVKCPYCNTKSLVEYFENVDYSNDTIIKNPYKIMYCCRKCNLKLGDTWWYSMKYPISTTTVENNNKAATYRCD